MSNETQEPTTTDSKQVSFGARLKSTREAKGFDRKDAAAQLRLTEKIIAMMEYERYPADMPVTFIKGYIRAYGKLLQIPEHEVRKALAPIKPKPVLPSMIGLKELPEPLTSGNYFMQLFSYLILFTIAGLGGMWWYTHPTLPTTTVVENAPPSVTENTPAANVATPIVQTPQSAENNAPPSIAVSNNTSAQTPIENNATTQASPTLAPTALEKTSVENSSGAPAESTSKNMSENNVNGETKNSATSQRVEDNTSAEQNDDSSESDKNNASDNNSDNQE